MSDAYQRILFRGVTVNRRTAAMLEAADRILGYELTITQGSYTGGVGASVGTHDGGGAVDLPANDSDAKVRALKRVGFAAWHRTAIPNHWPAHIHALAVGDAELAPLAKLQVDGYLQRRDGLGAWPFGPDLSWRPQPQPVFDYERERDMNLDDKINSRGHTVRDALRAVLRIDAEIDTLPDRIANLLPDGQPVTRADIRSAVHTALRESERDKP